MEEGAEEADGVEGVDGVEEGAGGAEFFAEEEEVEGEGEAGTEAGE